MIDEEYDFPSPPKIIDQLIIALIAKTYSYVNTAKLLKENNITVKGINIPTQFYAVKSYMESNFSKNLLLENLTKQANCSASHFSANFKKYFKTSPIHFINELKLKQALYYLKDINNNVSEIAEKLGYCNSFQFSKQFKKKYGLSPLQMRRKIMNHEV